MEKSMFNPNRLIVARKRRRLTAKALAEKADVTPVTITRLEKGINEPDEGTIGQLGNALKFPVEFFYLDDLDELDESSVSFRSLSRMRAKDKSAALSAGAVGVSLIEWLEQRFGLPTPDLIDLSYETNCEVAAQALRQHWGLGVKPISNLVHLLESKGVRFLSLSENTATVDAFSFWRNEKPFIFLNNFKTPERSVFDTAHELGHLTIHCHGESRCSPEAEKEANAFASAFLMPKDDVIARMPYFINVDTILKAKARWRVSAMAMAYRVHALKLISDWQYKSICIELAKRGYRSAEPEGIEREKSAIWKKALGLLWEERFTKEDIAKDLSCPVDEIESLLSGLVGLERESSASIGKEKRLHLV